MAHQLDEINRRVEPRLFVNRLPEHCTAEELKALVNTVVPAVEVKMLEGKPVGFVNLASWTDCATAMNALRGAEMRGSSLSVELCAREKWDKSPETRALATGAGFGTGRLFVGSIPLGSTEDDVRSAFASFGDAQVNLLPQKPGAKALAGYVTLANWGASLDAMAQFAEGPYRVMLAEEKGRPGPGGPAPAPMQRAPPVARPVPRRAAPEPAYVRAQTAPVYGAPRPAVYGGAPSQAAAGPNSRLFVGRMPIDIDEYTLESIFTPYGPCEISLLPAKGSTRCCFVNYQTVGSARAAVATIGSDPNLGFKVDFAEPKRGESAQVPHPAAPAAKRPRVERVESRLYAPPPVVVQPPMAMTNGKSSGKGKGKGAGKGAPPALSADAAVPRLFLGRLGGAGKADIEALCSAYGEVTGVVFLEAKGVAYVTFSSWLSAELAVEGIPSSGPTCQWATPKSGEPYGPTSNAIYGLDDTRLFVGNLDSADEAQLGEVFAAYGTVTQVQMLHGKGVGFVRFDRWGAAKDALANVSHIQAALGKPCNLTFAEIRRGKGQ